MVFLSSFIYILCFFSFKDDMNNSKDGYWEYKEYI